MKKSKIKAAMRCLPGWLLRGNFDELPAEDQALEWLSAETLNDGLVWLRYKLHQLQND
ncbi:MAG: hypothetical protein KF746_04350 [Chitinophagaceae bacterium]|nr:hypothetical protein [Chitinophagaceae bacterium]